MLGSSAVEQVTVNHLVAGSIPARAATENKGLPREVLYFFCIYKCAELHPLPMRYTLKKHIVGKKRGQHQREWILVKDAA